MCRSGQIGLQNKNTKPEKKIVQLQTRKNKGARELDNTGKIEKEAMLNITHAYRVYIVIVNNSNQKDGIFITQEQENQFHHDEKSHGKSSKNIICQPWQGTKN